MPNQTDFQKNPLAAMILLMAAFTSDPNGRLNNLNQAINNLRQAIIQINQGLNTFHTEVTPMFIKTAEKENPGQNQDEEL